MIDDVTSVNVEQVIARRRREWMADERKNISVLDRMSASIPWWLIIVAGGLFALSAPHTAAMMSEMTPGFGIVAPFVVEFGLLYAAFSRVKGRFDHQSMTGSLIILEILLFILSIAVNAAGALTAVVKTGGIEQLSAQTILSQLGGLPIITQVALALVPLFALIVPIGARAAGEGMAILILERRFKGSTLEQHWRDVEQDEIRRALYNEFIKHTTNKDARQRADAMSASISGRQRTMSEPRPIHAITDVPRVSVSAVREPVRASPGHGSEPIPDNSADARTKVWQYLTDNPSAVDLSVRKLGDAAGVSKTIAAEVLSQFKHQQTATDDGSATNGA